MSEATYAVVLDTCHSFGNDRTRNCVQIDRVQVRVPIEVCSLATGPVQRSDAGKKPIAVVVIKQETAVGIEFKYAANAGHQQVPRKRIE